MSHLDDLKDAMASPPDFSPQAVDLTQIMAAGGRVRRRRRIAVTAASGFVVAALLVGGAQLAGSSAGPGLTVPVQPAGPGQVLPDASASAGLDTSPMNGTAWGKVQSTGVGGWLIYASPINDSRIPQTGFGVNIAVADKSGKPVSQVITNETSGSDRAPGFHAVEGSMELDSGRTPVFGYYSGPATKITAVSGGKTVTAGQAAWSVDPTIRFFWFGGSVTKIDKLTAYGQDGRKLTTGHSQAGVG